MPLLGEVNCVLPWDFNLQSDFLWSFPPQIQHLEALSSTPSHECDHLQFFPALQPLSDLKYLQGVVDMAPPLPLLSSATRVAVADLSCASICFTLMGDEVVVGAVLINTNVSTSAKRH